MLSEGLKRVNTMRPEFFYYPDLVQAKALIASRVAEDAIASGGGQSANLDAAQAEEAIVASLSMTPIDSFLWLMYYSSKVSQNGFDPQYLAWLRQSYVAGPSEGWIALKRNRLALAVFPQLTEAMQGTVLSEFAQMVDADLIQDAALNLETVGWAQRERLAGALGQVDMRSRQALAKMLSRDGVTIDIPGVVSDDRRR